MESAARNLRVLIVANDSLARLGLAALLTDEPGLTVVGQAGETDLSGSQEMYHPDVVLWDMGWNTSPLGEHVAEQTEGAPVVALVANEDGVADAQMIGARAVIFRNADIETIRAAAVAVDRGLMILDPAFAKVTAAGVRSSRAAEDLTSREREVLILLADGLSNKLIARRLDISEHTVKFHVNAILGKLGVQSRTEAVSHAARLGLITL